MRPSDDELQATVSARAEEMGQDVPPSDIRILWMADDPAPGVSAFIARYTWADNRAALTGLVVDDRIVTSPGDAVAALFDRWEATGGFPDADRVADAVAFLLGSAGPQFVVHGDTDVDALVSQDEWKQHVQPPRLVTVDGQPGVRFWWLLRTDLSEMEVFRTAGGTIDVRNRFIRDFMNGSAEQA
jgi:hypothetical protein